MQKTFYHNDLISARSTPPGFAAIAVVRCSGEGALQLLQKITGKHSTRFESHKCLHTVVYDGETIVDDAIVIPFSEGRGYTGEESFEIHCHGSEVIVQLLLSLLQKHGARMADPGEFTRRAFLNGRISLDSAEAVMDIVHAGTIRAARIAVRVLTGGLDEKINLIKADCSILLAEIEVIIDYPDEELDVEYKKWKEMVNQLQSDLDNLLKGYRRGQLIREGITAVLLGRTNSGKSTLFNFLLNEEKAIVSDIHGTTRDFLDGVINVGGIGIRLYDTAGLRNSDDPIEMEGARRARTISQTADIVIYLVNAETGYSDEDIQLLIELNGELSQQVSLIIVHNKIDTITGNMDLPRKLERMFKNLKRAYGFCSMSALKQIGIEDFNTVTGSVMQLPVMQDGNDPLVTNQRHAVLLEEARMLCNGAVERLNEGVLDLAAFDIREILNHLGEITGEVTPADILDRIFSGFCVGK